MIVSNSNDDVEWEKEKEKNRKKQSYITTVVPETNGRSLSGTQLKFRNISSALISITP